MTTFERRFVTGQVEARALDGSKAVISGYAALFGKRSADLGGFVEVVDRGAFAKTLAESDTKFLFNHDESTVMARRTADNLRVSEDEQGLHYEATVDLNDPDARRLFTKIEHGNVRGNSFAFRTLVDQWTTTDDDYPLRHLVEVGPLYDVSAVTTPAYPDTEGQLAAAVRSLAATTGRDVRELVAAAQANELRSLMLPVDVNTDDDGPAESHLPPLDVYRRRLTLMQKALGAA